MSTRYLQMSQAGFYFTLGTPYKEDGDYESDRAYFEMCAPDIERALRALPFWKLTPEQAEDVMHVAPYELCEFDVEMDVGQDQNMACSFWIQSTCNQEFPREHLLAMREAIASAMAATFVKAQLYQEWKTSEHTDVVL